MPRGYRPSLERAPTRLTLVGVPVASIMIGSMLPVMPVVAEAAILPPVGLILLLAWRLLVRELWPVWAALPLGFFDDLFSGQPLGSAACIWTLMFLVIDLFDRRMMWRDYVQDWMLGSVLIIVALAAGLAIANATGGDTSLVVILPQMLVSILCLPIALRLCAALDRIRWQL